MDKDLQDLNQQSYTYHFFFHEGILLEFINLRDFVETVDNSLVEKLNLFRVNKLNEYSGHPYFNPELQLENSYPALLWQTTFLQTYFMMESALDEVCKNIVMTEGYNVRAEDMKGNGIRRAVLYLTKIANMKAPFEGETWARITDINEIRNIFVHSNGYAKRSNQKVPKYPERFQGLTVAKSFDEQSYMLILSKEFVLTVLEIVEKFFQEIHYHIQPANRQL